MRNNRGVLSLLVVVALLAGACGGSATLSGAAVAKLSSADPTEEALKNGAYEIPNLGPVQLSDGSYEKSYGSGATMTNKVGYLQAAFGDLNKDGSKDAAVAIWGNSGGSGTFIYLIAVTNQSKTLRQASNVLLGDRVQMKSLTIEGGKIVVTTLGFAANDPQCCPSLPKTQTFTLKGNTLTEAP